MSTDIPDLIAGALGVSRGTAYDMMREALAKQYAEKNSLGGPAKVFDAMADAIRAGDDYHAVLRQYGFVEAQKQEPVSSDEIGIGCECANCANGMGECQKEEAQPQEDPVFWYRPCSNGMYEGPIHNAQIERVRKESGAWHPLYTAPQPAQQQEPVAEVAGRAGDLHIRFLPSGHSLQLGDKLYTSPPASKPLPEDYTALEQALTRLQKRYADLEGRASKPLTDEQKDAARYRWLKARLMGADFDWNESGACALVFEWPEDVPVGVDCDQNIDAAIEAAHAKGDA